MNEYTNQPFNYKAAIIHIKIKKMDSPSWPLEATFIASSLCEKERISIHKAKKHQFTGLKRGAQIDAGVI